MHKKLCGGNWGLCDEMKHVDGLDINEHLKNVEFLGKTVTRLEHFFCHSISIKLKRLRKFAKRIKSQGYVDIRTLRGELETGFVHSL